MDHNHHRHRRRPSSDRFLSTFSPPTAIITTTTSDDFSEDDIFSTTVSPTTTTNHHQPPPQPPKLRHNNSFSNQPHGILAALHDSPSRTISIIPQHRKSPLSLSPKYPQSAPMHVPFLPTFRQRGVVGDAVAEDEDEDDDEDGEMLPPHELVAKRLAETPVLSTSVLEGAGRTLKGRDLRQVRNAVFRHTGFID